MRNVCCAAFDERRCGKTYEPSQEIDLPRLSAIFEQHHRLTKEPVMYDHRRRCDALSRSSLRGPSTICMGTRLVFTSKFAVQYTHLPHLTRRKLPNLTRSAPPFRGFEDAAHKAPRRSGGFMLRDATRSKRQVSSNGCRSIEHLSVHKRNTRLSALARALGPRTSLHCTGVGVVLWKTRRTPQNRHLDTRPLGKHFSLFAQFGGLKWPAAHSHKIGTFACSSELLQLISS